MGILASHETEITLVLNGLLNSDAYENASSPSLSQLLKHGPNDDIAGGQEILSFRAPGGGLEGNRRLTATSDFDLTELSALGNSIIGGAVYSRMVQTSSRLSQTVWIQLAYHNKILTRSQLG